MNVDLEDDEISALLAQDANTLSRWWCELNRYEWPDGLPRPIPKEEREHSSMGSNRAWKIMCWISKRVGQWLISREWNKDNMKPDEHDAWFAETYWVSGPTPAP